MKKILLLLALLFPIAAHAQTAAYNSFCDQGGVSAVTSGLNSTNKVDGIIPYCTVTVYLDGVSQVSSATYTSGATITGTVGQTCNASFTGGTPSGSGSIALTGSNVIAGGTHFSITPPGVGQYAAAPTTATLTNGTASCSGTATVVTTLVPIKATIFKDSVGTSQTNPYQTLVNGQILFYAATGQGYDIVKSGGIPPLTYITPLTVTDWIVPTGGGSGVVTQLIPGIGTTVTPGTGVGVVAVNVTPGANLDLEQYGTPVPNQGKLNAGNLPIPDAGYTPVLWKNDSLGEWMGEYQPPSGGFGPVLIPPRTDIASTISFPSTVTANASGGCNPGSMSPFNCYIVMPFPQAGSLDSVCGIFYPMGSGPCVLPTLKGGQQNGVQIVRTGSALVNTNSVVWSGFSTSGFTPSAVVDIWAYVIAGKEPAWPSPYQSALSVVCGDGAGHTATVINGLYTIPNTTYAVEMSGTPSTFNWGSGTCTATNTDSTTYINTQYFNISQVGIIAYYAGTPAPAAAEVIALENCLYYNPGPLLMGIQWPCNYAQDTGTVNAMVANISSIPAITPGFDFVVTPAHNNTTTTPTIEFNGPPAITITKCGGQPLVAGGSPDIQVPTGGVGADAHLEYNESNIELLNPINGCGSGGGSGITALTGDVTASGSGSVAATAVKLPGHVTLTGTAAANDVPVASSSSASAWGPPFSLTTTGSSGASTFSGGVLNVPQYIGGSGSASLNSQPGLWAFGDSITVGLGTVPEPTNPPTNCRGGGLGAPGAAPNSYPVLVEGIFGAPLFDYAECGDQAADVATLWEYPNLNPTYDAQPAMSVQIATNDIGTCGVTTGCEANFSAALMSINTWAAIPNQNKVLMGTNTQVVSTTGTWVTDSTLQTNLALKTDVPGGTLTFTTLENSTVVYLSWMATDGDTATAAYSCDSGAVTGTLNAFGFSGQTISTGTWATTTVPFVTRLVFSGNTTHTCVVTPTVTTGNFFSLVWAGTPFPSVATDLFLPTMNTPRVFVGNLLHNYSGSGSVTDADLAAYSTIIANQVTQLAGDGLNVTLVDYRDTVVANGMNGASFTLPNGLSYAGSAYPPYHPNIFGQTLMANALAIAAKPTVNGITCLTGDILTTCGQGVQTATLPTVNSAGSGTCGSSTQSCVITYNQKGQVINVTTAAISGGGGGGAVTQIGQVVVSSPVASITFSGIPGSYTSLKLIVSGQSSLAVGPNYDKVDLRFNGDTGADYDSVFLSDGSPTTATSAAFCWVSYMSAVGAVLPGSFDATIPSYTSSTFGKTLESYGGMKIVSSPPFSSGGMCDWSGPSGVPAAITSITIYMDSGSNWVTGSTATLYGYQ